MDSAKSHITEEVKKQIKKHSKIAVFPTGLTKLLQPLDISVNESFKNKLKSFFWLDSMVNGYHTFIKGGNTGRTFYIKVCHWIIKSWGLITP